MYRSNAAFDTQAEAMAAIDALPVKPGATSIIKPEDDPEHFVVVSDEGQAVYDCNAALTEAGQPAFWNLPE